MKNDEIKNLLEEGMFHTEAGFTDEVMNNLRPSSTVVRLSAIQKVLMLICTFVLIFAPFAFKPEVVSRTLAFSLPSVVWQVVSFLLIIISANLYLRWRYLNRNLIIKK